MDVSIDAGTPSGESLHGSSASEKPPVTGSGSVPPFPPVSTPKDLLAEIESRLAAAPDLVRDPTAQRLLGELVGIIVTPGKKRIDNDMEAARVAAQLLLCPEPRIQAAAQVIEFLSSASGHDRLSRHRSPAFWTFAGLGSSVYVIGAAFAAYRSLVHTHGVPEVPAFYDVPFVDIAGVVIAGALGSTVSMMGRIQDIDPLRLSDRWLPFLMGLFRPIIGIAFALFAAACIQSELITFAVNDDKRIFFVLAVAFVAGFSERLAPDLIDKVEGRLTQKADEPAPPKTAPTPPEAPSARPAASASPAAP